MKELYRLVEGLEHLVPEELKHLERQEVLSYLEPLEQQECLELQGQALLEQRVLVLEAVMHFVHPRVERKVCLV